MARKMTAVEQNRSVINQLIQFRHKLLEIQRDEKSLCGGWKPRPVGMVRFGHACVRAGLKDVQYAAARNWIWCQHKSHRRTLMAKVFKASIKAVNAEIQKLQEEGL